MVYLVYGLAFYCVMSSILLVLAILKIRKITSKKHNERDNTRDASELLARLLSGGAVIVTQIIDPESILLHSPRDM